MNGEKTDFNDNDSNNNNNTELLTYKTPTISSNLFTSQLSNPTITQQQTSSVVNSKHVVENIPTHTHLPSAVDNSYVDNKYCINNYSDKEDENENIEMNMEQPPVPSEEIANIINKITKDKKLSNCFNQHDQNDEKIFSIDDVNDIISRVLKERDEELFDEFTNQLSDKLYGSFRTLINSSFNNYLILFFLNLILCKRSTGSIFKIL